MKHNQKKINNFFFAIFALFLILGAAVPAAADTTVAWSQEIGNVAAADMSEDGQTIYAAVGSQVLVYDSAGVQQNVFTVGGTVVKLVCTADGTRAALYTNGNDVYYIDNGALTWSHNYDSQIFDLDISNIGTVLCVMNTQLCIITRTGDDRYYDITPLQSDIGRIDPDGEFVITANTGSNRLAKYISVTSSDYWAVQADNTSFSTAFQDYQNVLILNTNQTNAIVLNSNTLGEELWNEIYSEFLFPRFAVSDSELNTTNSEQYYEKHGATWSQATASAQWSARYHAATWVYNDRMYIAGGYNGTTAFNDVWYSTDGETWTLATSAAQWGARYGAMSWVANNRMYIAGGYTGTAALADIWYSTNGITWTRQTISGSSWSARYFAHAWVYNNRIYVGGGYSGTAALTDVWYSQNNGLTWTQATNSIQWLSNGGGCSWVSNDYMWVFEPYIAATNPSTNCGVYRSSDGITWSRTIRILPGFTITSNLHAGVWVLNNGVWLGGGVNVAGTTRYNNIVGSFDGSTWTLATSAAQWSARYGAATWVYHNRFYIAGGYTGSTALNDVWRDYSTELIIQPSDNSQTYLFYNFTGSNQNDYTLIQYQTSEAFDGSTDLQTKPTLSILNHQITKSLTGNVQSISLSDRGDWVGTATTTNIYHDQITSSGFGTEYYAALGSTGTVYDVATTNSAAMSILGQGQTTDIYSMSTARVGTYTAGGAVQYVDLAAKNSLWATSGGADGKVYIFSKDESSNWYLEYSSDSEDPITALKMSSRGEFVLAGRTSSLTLYQTNTPEQTDTNFWFTLYIYKDSDSYRQAAVNVSVYNINNQWQSFAEGLTDSSGKFVLQLTAGNTYKFDVANGQKVLVYQAAPSVPSQVVSIHTSPVSAALTYEAEWDPEIGGVTFDYMDSTGQTQTVIVKIIRTDTWETVYEQTYTGQQSIEQSVPIVDDTVGYKVELSASRSSGITRNTWFVSSSRDIVPIPLDTNVKNILFSCFLIFLAGLFSYLSAFRGAIVVCLSAIFFTYMGWLTIPWHWLVVAVVLAFVAGFTQRRT